MALDAGDITARQAGYLNEAGMLTDLGKLYVDEILERLGVPKRGNNIGLTASEIGKLNAGVKRQRNAIALDVARKKARR